MKSTASFLTKSSGKLSLITLAVLASSIALADESGWYLGGNVGRSAVDIDTGRINSGLQSQGLLSSSISERDSDTGYKLFGGYQLNRYLAVETGYFDLGKFGFTANTVPLGTLNGNIRLNGLNLDVVGTLPITDRFSILGRAGVTYTKARDTFSGTGAVGVLNPNPSTRDTNYKLGLGLQYAFTDNLAMRLEAERYRVDDAIGNKGDADLISVGLIYRFGGKTPAPVARYAAPEPVREVVVVSPPPPPPAPVAVVPAPPPPPPPPQFERVSLSATELFGFDSAVLQMPQPKLDEIASALNQHGQIGDVDIIGYTDHLGAAQYNQKLSEQRAIAVRNYLTNKGVAPERLRAKGMAEANPVVVCTDKNRAALIKCLEPNRRVEVERITFERRVK